MATTDNLALTKLEVGQSGKETIFNAAIERLDDAATTTAQGIIELATQAEVNTGTDAVRAVTPSTLRNATGIFGDFSSNTSSSVDSEIVLFSSTGGKTGKRATTTGILKGTSGVLSAATAGTDYVSPTGTETLTNKRITKRVDPAADATSITPNINAHDLVSQVNTQGAGTLTFNAPTGTPTDGQQLMLRVKLTNTQTTSFNAIYRGSTDLALPAALAGSKTHYLGFIYNSTDTKYDLLALNQGF